MANSSFLCERVLSSLKFKLMGSSNWINSLLDWLVLELTLLSVFLVLNGDDSHPYYKYIPYQSIRTCRKMMIEMTINLPNAPNWHIPTHNYFGTSWLQFLWQEISVPFLSLWSPESNLLSSFSFLSVPWSSLFYLSVRT